MAAAAASAATHLWRRLSVVAQREGEGEGEGEGASASAAAAVALPHALVEPLARIERLCAQLRRRGAAESGAAEHARSDTTRCYYSALVLMHETPKRHVESKARVGRCIRALHATRRADPAQLRLMWPRSSSASAALAERARVAQSSRFEPAARCAGEAAPSALEMVECAVEAPRGAAGVGRRVGRRAGRRGGSRAARAAGDAAFKRECVEIAIAAVHSGEHLRELDARASESRALGGAPVAMPYRKASHRRRNPSDTFVSAGSVRAARAAAQACCDAVDGVLSGAARNAFCLVRPPVR